MGRAYLLVIIATIFLLVIFLTNITMRLRYRKQGRNDHFALDLTLWRGFIHYKLEIPVMKTQALDKQQKKKQPGLRPLLWPQPAYKIQTEIRGKGDRLIAKEKKRFQLTGVANLFNILYWAILKIKKYYPVVRYLLKHIKLRRFCWCTEIGMAEPSQTGILTGTAWGLKGFVFSYVYRMFTAGEANPVINVKPNFKTACFNTSLDCIFEVRFGYIIFTRLNALAIRLK